MSEERWNTLLILLVVLLQLILRLWPHSKRVRKVEKRLEALEARLEKLLKRLGH
jgi:predicted Holliday junction resolvase-like endonuclease